MNAFLLHYPPSDRLRVDWHANMEYKVVAKCPLDPEHIFTKRTEPLEVVPSSVGVADVMWTIYECIVSARVRSLLTKCKATGVAFDPVVVHATPRTKAAVSQLGECSVLRVTGWGGIASPQCGARETERCPGCTRARYSGVERWLQVLDETAWDGSDFFMVWPMPTHIFVTRKIAEMLAAESLRHFRCIPVEDLRPTQGYTPGRITDWMDETTARRQCPQLLA